MLILNVTEKKNPFVQSAEDHLEKLHSSVSKKILQAFYWHLAQLELNKCSRPSWVDGEKNSGPPP